MGREPVIEMFGLDLASRPNRSGVWDAPECALSRLVKNAFRPNPRGGRLRIGGIQYAEKGAGSNAVTTPMMLREGLGD